MTYSMAQLKAIGRANYREQLSKDSEEMKKQEALNSLEKGQVVHIDPRYDWTEKKNGKKFFVTRLGKDSVLLADTKKQAINGKGYIYSICNIIIG